MNEAMKEVVVMSLITIGHIFLWGSIIIGFLDWTYDMGFFRISIVGLFLIVVSKYFSYRWNVSDE